MFAFEIWGKFASFRDPFTISQNISFPIPPKTTVAGMMASVLGLEEYFEDSTFSEFEYSVVAVNPIRKKSFSQNYINDYTSKVQMQLNNLKKSDFEKLSGGLRDKKNPQKPINREILLDVKYLIFIKNFRYEKEIVEYLSKRVNKFPFYLGNSEFAGNYKWLEICNVKETLGTTKIEVDSFVLETDIEHIEFEEGVRYSSISFATQLEKNRTPAKFGSVIFSSSKISVKNLSVYEIDCCGRNYYCRFL